MEFLNYDALDASAGSPAAALDSDFMKFFNQPDAGFFGMDRLDSAKSNDSASEVPFLAGLSSPASPAAHLRHSEEFQRAAAAAALNLAAVNACGTPYEQAMQLFGVSMPLLSAAPVSSLDAMHRDSAVSVSSFSPLGSPGFSAPLLGLPLAPLFSRSNSADSISPLATLESQLSSGSISPLNAFESQLSSGFNSALPSSPASPTPHQLPTGTTDAAPAKTKKKRRPKPRMCDLNEQQAKAKRDANRESARKCRERKRDREQSVVSEADVLRMEVEQLKLALATERTKNAMLEKLLLDGDSALGLGAAKRMRLE